MLFILTLDKKKLFVDSYVTMYRSPETLPISESLTSQNEVPESNTKLDTDDPSPTPSGQISRSLLFK